MATDNLYMAVTDHQHRSFSQVLVKKKADSVKNQPWTYRVFEESHPDAGTPSSAFFVVPSTKGSISSSTHYLN